MSGCGSRKGRRSAATNHVQLRAERAGTGNSRVYTITITCTNSAGQASSQTVTVAVPHDDRIGWPGLASSYGTAGVAFGF